MERCRVVSPEVLVANPGAEVQVLAVHARTQGKQVAVPVLEPGAHVPGLAPEAQLAVELASLEAPREVEPPGERVALGREEIERGPGIEGGNDQLAGAVAPGQVGG